MEQQQLLLFPEMSYSEVSSYPSVYTSNIDPSSIKKSL